MSEPLLQRVLDRSIFWSFDRSGYQRHRAAFRPEDLERSMRGKICLVTGANSGLGLEVARGLAARDATVHLLCRDAARGQAALADIVGDTGNQDVHLEILDVARPESVRDFADRWSAPQVDVLIHNAGVLPLERELTDTGLELTVATHLVGPFLLTELLRAKLHGSRVVFVTSGGMYTKRLNVSAMLRQDGPYDGVAAYAMTKRGQVVLSARWARELASSGTVVNAMHPGWAATPGVQRSLPRFWRIMQRRLRTPAEGADTALWLAVAETAGAQTGKLWFDRLPVGEHLVPWTQEPAGEAERLWALCERAVAEHGKGKEA